MNGVRRGVRWSLVVAASVGFLWPLGCDEQSATQQVDKDFMGQYERDYRRQQDVLEKQNAEWERQVKKLKEQDARYDAILAKWEDHSQEVDALLDRWDRILSVLEAHSGDQ